MEQEQLFKAFCMCITKNMVHAARVQHYMVMRCFSRGESSKWKITHLQRRETPEPEKVCKHKLYLTQLSKTKTYVPQEIISSN